MPEDGVTDSQISQHPKGPGDLAETGSSKGEWKQDDTGWWYVRPDQTYPVSQWSYIGDKWYYFGADGYMKTGWICLDEKWYFLDEESGAMYADTVTPDGYLVGADGAWIM